MHVGYREGVWTFSKYFSLNVSPSLQDILFGQRNSFTPTALHMWAVASSFNYLLFFDFVLKIGLLLSYTLFWKDSSLSPSLFQFRFSCHFRYASNFGSFPRFSSRASHFKKTLFTSAINPSVDYSLFLFSSFPRISSRVSFFYRCQPMVSNHSSNVIFNMFLTRKNSVSL